MIYFTIYKTTCLINKKIYIGQHITSDLEDNYLGSGSILSNAIKKYGRENFRREILCFCKDKVDLNKKEIELIEKYNCRNKNTGYNITIGGLGSYGFKHADKTKAIMSFKAKGRIVSEETRMKQSKARIGKFKGRVGFFNGKKFDTKHKQNISRARIGYVMPEKTKEKISKKRKELKLVNSEKQRLSASIANMGKKLSEEHKVILSKKILIKNSEKSKCVYCNVVTNIGNLKRWHNENCRFNESN